MSGTELGSPSTTSSEVMAQLRDLWPKRDLVDQWALSLLSIGMEMPPRISFRQGAAFALVAAANAYGRRITMTDVRDFFNEREGTSGVAQSLAKSFQIFLEPTKQEPNGLGWVYQEMDKDDRRRKYLCLTQEGAEAVLRAVDARKSKEEQNATLQNIQEA